MYRASCVLITSSSADSFFLSFVTFLLDCIIDTNANACLVFVVHTLFNTQNWHAYAIGNTHSTMIFVECVCVCVCVCVMLAL